MCISVGAMKNSRKAMEIKRQGQKGRANRGLRSKGEEGRNTLAHYLQRKSERPEQRTEGWKTKKREI